jgi:hypothetical protein
MNKEQIRGLIRDHGVAGFSKLFEGFIGPEGLAAPNGQTYRLRPENMSLKQLWEGLVGPIQETFDNAFWQESDGGALDHTGFPSISEKLLSRVMIEGYENEMGVADQLVTASTSPSTLTERIVGFTMPDGPHQILPGEPYPTVGLGEKYVTFEEALDNKKEGFEIQVTEEAVRFDQTNLLMDRARNAGMTLQTERERRTVRAVLGIGLDTGTALSKVYFPSGTDTALYRAAVSNLRTDASPIYNHPGKSTNSQLEDYTDFQEVLTTHAQNITDDRQVGTGRPIVWNPNVVLAPVSLGATLANILNATGIEQNSFSTGATTFPQTRTVGANPMRSAAMFGGNTPTPVTSPYVDEVSSTMWIVYDRNRTFVRINIFPFQVFRPTRTDELARRDVLVSVRVREWSRVIARDHRTAIRNDGV